MVPLLIISFLITLIYSGLILYYTFLWKGIKSFTSVYYQPSTVISIIIPARNEEQNIQRCIESILQQSYPKELFEIIVVDDHSEDNTAVIVKKYAEQNVKQISLKDHVSDRLNSYKKKAIEVAISQAKGKLIVTTDADCIAGPNWLQTIAAYYEEHQPAFIAMPVAINEGKSFIEIFQSLDFMTLQGITGAVVSKNRMTMCNGANMVYERDAFYEVNGFAGIDNIASGDDMLMMHKIYKRYPDRIAFLKSKEVIVKTATVHSISAFMNQRIRWASKSGNYDDKRILPILILVYLLNVLLLTLPVIAIFNNNGLTSVNCHLSTVNCWLLFLLVKTVIELVFLYPVAKFFSKQKLLFFFPIMQPFHLVYTVIAGWLGKFGSYKWKGRQVN